MIPSPSPPTDGSLMGVTAVSATDIWAVGTVESAGSGYQTLIEHWNGSTWQIVPSPSPGSFYNFLQGITAVSATDLWAVGYYQPGYTDQPLLLHWDGHTWSQVRAGQSTVSRHRLEAAVSATNVWTVGTIGPTDAQQTLTLHWNGQQWQPVSSPSPAAYSNALHSVIALGPSNVWAAGDTNDQSSGAALFVHWDGTGWSRVPSPGVGQIESLAAEGASDLWAVGHTWDGSFQQTLTQHWDGTGWTVVASPNPAPFDNLLWGVVAVDGTAWAVGSAQMDDTVQQTLALRATTACGTPTATPTGCPVQFSDVPAGTPFYDNIRCLACRGIVGGYSDGTFRPGNAVTRGQLSKFISNAAGYSDAIPATRQTFTDVPPSHVFWLAIERAYAHGVIGGYSDAGHCPGGVPCFQPAAAVTRGQTVKFVAGAAGYADEIPPTQQTFADVPPSHVFWLAIERVALHDVVGGYTCGNPEPCPGRYFRPGAPVTRGQTAKFISNAFFPGCGTPLGH